MDTGVRKSSAFDNLPDEIIELILQLTTPDSFASLILLNRKWRAVSQQAHLYAHHLSKCPSYSAAHPTTTQEPIAEENLPRLRGLFSREIKRNLFEAYLRPNETTIRLVSNSISSSSAPGGEAFHFDISPQGHFVLAYSSSRIHVIDVRGEKLVVKRELKILRRPLSTTITDDGTLLAVLSNDLHVNLYDLAGEHPKHVRVVTLENAPRTIALSPTGSVLAAAYENGVEVLSLDPEYFQNGGRAVKCYTVDALSFSKDGTQLLGTTLQSQNPSIVVLSAPYFSPGGQAPEQSVSALWTTSILFPNGSRDCSHAVLLPQPYDGEASWTFTYDRVFETFRAVRIDDLRNGTTYFTGPEADLGTASKLLPSTLPAASGLGDLVAAGFKGSVWIYGVPEDLDAPPVLNNSSTSNSESEATTPSSQVGRRSSIPSIRSVGRREPNNSRAPQWQLLSDKLRNTFVQGRKILALDGVKAVSWVNNENGALLGERLVAVAPGVGTQPSTFEDEGMSPMDGGRISILDFNYSTNDGKKTSITIEVGVIDPEPLEEEQRDMATEVALVRRRTVAQKRGDPSNVARSMTRVIRPQVAVPSLPNIPDELSPPSSSAESGPAPQMPNTADSTETASIEEQEAFDAPYSQGAPRSVTTLRRAATAAAANRRLHPRAAAGDHIEYRRADGRNEHPHESDADNWVPPPPPYTKDPVPTLPEYLQRAVLGDTLANLQRANVQRSGSIVSGFSESSSQSSGLHRSHTTASSTSNFHRQQESPFFRSFSDIPTRGLRRNSSVSAVTRPLTSPITSPVSPEFDDLYDVSPPRSPQPTLPVAVSNQPTHHIPRRPVGANAGNQPTTPTSISQHSTTQTPPRVIHSSTSQSPSQRPTRNNGQPPSTPAGPPLRSQTDPDISPTQAPQSRQQQQDHSRSHIWRRSGTTQTASAEGNAAGSSPVTTKPTPEQLARLNARGERPPSVTLTDPPRRGHTSFNQLWHGASWSTTNLTSHRHNNSQPPLTSTQTAQSGTHGSSPAISNTQSSTRPSQPPRVSYTQPPPQHTSGSRQNPRHLSSTGVPTPTQRLENGYSVTVSAEPSAYHPRAMTIGRQPSRAERSAAKNIKDAKKNGWKAVSKHNKNKRKQKDKYADGASSAGWTDITREDSGTKYKESSGKCAIM
ncbi:hypothetical protein F5884DRAFT_672436 [Xylogone sp. PMI_703]|nr:hypothetical protein F5884DRAFT_672436 [Xylogone sp. PMI_703]